MIDSLNDLLTDGGFRAGVGFGILAGVVVVLAGLVVRRPVPWAGLGVAAATLAGIADRYPDLDEVTVDVATGSVVLALGVAIAGAIAGRWGGRADGRPRGAWTPSAAVAQAVAAVPGAAIVAGAAATDRSAWAMPCVLAATVVGGGLVAGCDRVHGRSGVTPVMLAVSAFGVYVTTPDTEHAAVLLGAAVPLVLLGWPRSFASLGAAGSFVSMGVLAWIAVLDGSGRDGAVVGALACLGMLAVEPVARGIASRSGGTSPAPWVRGPLVVPARISPRQVELALVGGHVGLVFVCSRIAGGRTSAAAALLIAAAAYVVAGLCWAAVVRRTADVAPDTLGSIRA